MEEGPGKAMGMGGIVGQHGDSETPCQIPCKSNWLLVLNKPLAMEKGPHILVLSWVFRECLTLSALSESMRESICGLLAS